MENNQHIGMMSIEIGALWSTYFSETTTRCMIIHFLENVEDPDIELLLTNALTICNKRIPKIEQLLGKENFPIPQGFTDKDVHSKAPRLFSDPFYLYYIWFMSSMELQAHSLSMTLCARTDVNDFYRDVLNDSADTDMKSRELALKKGYFIRAPHIPTPSKVDFVKRQSFLTGWFGERRPLNALEITHLFKNAMTNTIGNLLITGFSQVTESKDIRNLFVRGKEISAKHVTIFNSILKEEDLSSFDSWAAYVTDSTTPPFSEKLMLFHITSLNSVGIGNYGISISASSRRDLGTHYTRLMGEIALYTEDGANLMIEKGWMEQPPQAANRDQLIR
ncbi:DUF3231 family protein [Halalkalibacter krulwichiae]|uniref:DUF3231 domain-containing protein n=1 Tax=Halalkalibacter krulwichiae TaxID=199441 RepID=A0A1X9MJN0_9BACI|nr:DUF3231 family protein [Halalkalibacter krulwichiae]ARK32493.1 hypothetical protein BkAM31D_22960 [Halalkalibacter krulwichiae]